MAIPDLKYPGGKLTCGVESCGNDDPAKFKPERAKSGSTNPLTGINLRCTVCDTLYDMSKTENQPD